MRTMCQLFSGLRFRLVLLVVLASLPPVVLTLHIARQDRQRQTAALRQRSQDMVKLAARKEDEMIAGTRQLLRALAESSQVQSARWGNCTKLLRTLFADSRYANLGVIKTNGNVAASALPLTNTVSLADRSFFQRALATRDLSLGDYEVGRISGKPSFNLGYPVFDPSGRVQSVVFAALDLDWLNGSDYALQMQLPEGATWTKIDGKGTILTRYPAPEKWLVGQPLPEQSLLKTFLAQKNGVLEAVGPQGSSVFYDFTSTRSALVAGDVISILSVPRKVLFAVPNRVMMRNLTSVGIVAGLVLALGWIGSRYLILRPIQALVSFTAQLGAGDYGTRTGLPRAQDELRQLMGAFDQMAEALQQREAERQSADNALKASELRYRRLFETAQDGILILNADTGEIDDVNPFLTDLLGYTREQLLGNKFWEIGPFRDTKASKAEFRELQHGAYHIRYDDLPLETSAGKSINVEFVSNVYQVNGGKVIQCNIRDITKRKRAEEELRSNEVRLRGVVESTADGLLVVDRNGRVMIQNARFGKMWSIPSELLAKGDDNALLAHVVVQLSHPEDFLARVRALYDTDAEDMDEVCFKDGRVFERFSRPLVLDGAVMGRVWSFRDITERKRAQGKLKESRQRLQVLSRRLVEVQETERRHLARELHDEIGQALTATEMNLQALLESPGTAALTRRLKESLQVVERVQEQVHDLSLNLRPSMLDDLGLEPALRWYTERQAALAGLQAEVRAVPLEQRLDPMIETECFRITQEALTNVVKHAKAHTVTVELSKNDDDAELHLSVRDDGVGFDVASVREQAVRGASLGLLSMEERATLAGGGLEYDSTPGQGTEVHAWFPLKWAQPAVLIGAV